MKFSKILFLSAVLLTTVRTFTLDKTKAKLDECQMELGIMEKQLDQLVKILDKDGYFTADGELKPKYLRAPYV